MFNIAIKTESNIFEKLLPEEYRHLRRRMIETMLATDISKYLKEIATIKSKLEINKICNGENLSKLINEDEKDVSKNFKKQQDIFNLCIHFADISNPAREQYLNDKWVNMLYEEFFNQGDIEANLNIDISPLCDRKTTNIDSSQIGFISYVLKPSLEVLLNVVSEANYYLDKANKSLDRHKKLSEET